jgi:SMC interacting uncharacterized protein involved in chromosome segregation
MSDLDEVLEQLKQKRDELRVQMHLASKEVQDEWEDLEKKMNDFSEKAKKFAKDAELKETGSGLGSALGQVGNELKAGYDRIRKALKD